MNKEEKRINYLLDTIIECPSMQADELRKRIRKLFKTIEKQQKEIENLRKTNKILFEQGQQNAIQELLSNKYIRKDKIKEKIKELEEEGTTQYWDNEVQKMLQELLGEENE